MAIYHARVRTFSRAKGHSSVAAAAYRAGLLLVDEKTGGQFAGQVLNERLKNSTVVIV